MLSQKAFVADKGHACPHCGGHEMTTEKPEHEITQEHGARIVADTLCHACGAMWTEIYELAGYDNFEKNARERLNGES